MQGAAAGHALDAAIREHLASCGDCRGAVRELRGVVGQPTDSHGRYRRSLLARPAFWLLLVALAGLAYGVWRWERIKSPPAERTTTAAAPPVTAPAPPVKVRRVRPPRAAAVPAKDPDIKSVAIVDVIRKNQPGVRMCYERALKREPLLSVRRLDVRLNVSAAGVVDRVSFGDLPDEAVLSNCIRNTIRTWKFSPATAAYETTFSLHLQPGD
jgi:hypothetical protein